MNWIKCEQQPTNAIQKSKQIIDKGKEHYQMTAKHYIRTITMITMIKMIQYSEDIWKEMFVEKKQWTKNI